ncbi:hypothetical protein PFISCL1PPCAC_18807 [Pristionchus fissidentatus]|uniref:FERM domain-containing protein n=1 Tax=Pristionchus fissidentatus TaxID=1538716 RepID=A0AAV5WAS5_9BILA|nr:hypothetical protein PFISCL1PPCAC_18807 [Pristionchus fissidentatus]
MERNNNNKSTTSLFGRMSARASFISKKELKVTIQLLNDAETINTEFKKSATGKDVLDYVCKFLNITEKDYFGLRYQDHHRHRYWVDLTQSLSSLAKLFKSENLAFRLRFRYYPSSASQLREEITRYQLNVQLQRDLLHGRLYCPQPIGAQLAAYILQSQIGDHDSPTGEEGARYVSEYKLLLKQTPKVEEKIAELHHGLRGMSAAEAELRMIEMACQLETYGFDPYTVKDPKNPATSVYIGATHRGILVFHGSQKAHHMQWSEVTKLDYTGNELRIYPCEGYEPMVELENGTAMNGGLNSTLNQTHTSESMMAANQSEIEKENDVSLLDKSHKATTKMLRYTCPSRPFAKHLWVHLLSQKTFFNEISSEGIKPLFSKPRIPLFTRGSTFRFPSQRVLKEIETSPMEERPPVVFARYDLPKQTPRMEMPNMTKYQTLPNLKLNGHLRNGSTGGTKSELNSPTEEKKVEVSSLETNLMDISPSSSKSPSSVTSTLTTVINAPTPPSNGTNNVSPLGEPIAHSTPKAAELRERKVNSNGGTIKEEEKKTSKQVRFTVDEKKSSSVRSSPSLTSRVINLVFLMGLLLLILVFTSILLFERQESTQFVDSKPWLVDLRSQYYQPIKEIALQKYNAVFSR